MPYLVLGHQFGARRESLRDITELFNYASFNPATFRPIEAPIDERTIFTFVRELYR